MPETYDVVIVGAGMAGALLAKELSGAGKRVLVLEAGTGTASTFAGYLQDLTTFYTAVAKVPESPYPFNPDAPQPDVLDIGTHKGYFVQLGPQPFSSTYTRTAGGTMLHWLGTCLRMLPEDFELRTRFGVGLDWPLGYDDLERYYALAEFEIGVAADVDDQRYLGIAFPHDYVYPMHRIPPSWLDQTMAASVDGMPVTLGQQTYKLKVRSTPQGRNSTPNPHYRNPHGNHGYTPVGAVDPRPQGQDLGRRIGQRCEGNTNCVPICPVQAKYNALKTLERADRRLTTVRMQAVASRIMIDPASGAVTGIEYQAYQHPQSPEHTTEVATGRVYVLAAHAIENAKLLLASGLEGTSRLVGKNLMDHPVLLTWGLMPEKVGALRGPLSTSGIEDLRGGEFRREYAAFRVEIGNEGWNWAMGAPESTVKEAVLRDNMFGLALRRHLNDRIPRQFRLGFLMEQLPSELNRVSIDPRYRDQLGNYQPVINYDLSDYTLEGMAVAKTVSAALFQQLRAQDFTDPASSQVNTIGWRGQSFAWGGAGHVAGTHIMGTTPGNSVVDRDQRSWDQRNLFVVGCGSFPTVATSNPTLTMVALACRTAEVIRHDLDERITIESGSTSA